MNKDIEKIAGKHLGKTSDGSTMQRYETPNSVDKSLLVGVPRSLNREAYGIKDPLPFVGYDVWHAYEMSYLLQSGMPVTAVVKIIYPANSDNIVESKSLKLYLNSFNMHKFSLDRRLAYQEVKDTIKRDLSEVLGLHGYQPDVELFEDISSTPPFIDLMWDNLDYTDYPTTFNDFTESPELLKVVDNGVNNYTKSNLKSSLLRSNCRVTNQPDWGDLYISYTGRYSIQHTSLMKYIISFRGENHFHEEVCEMIYTRLYKILQPSKLMVACLYTRRGGIDINPIRASDRGLIATLPIIQPDTLTQKTLRQ